ncbi:heavy-metal-associated domain-containing protein [Sphingomonas sp. 1P06PA]|uniref:heavy-metal-associated domain-containing protein n=1 Tax=Sphingomonas sp. 1P06PA TaxID=554121 RepID=UPI0039A4AC75
MTRSQRSLALLAVLAAAAGAGTILLAQIEGSDRGVPPIDSSSSYEVTGVAVDVSGKDAETARLGGWRQAQRLGWRMLYARINGISPKAAPGLPDGTLDSIVAGIVVEQEQVSERRYIARLGVLFDRARAGRLLGVQGRVARSAPMLVIPVMWSGGAPVSLERRNPWQEAWARFRTGGSPVDYVRPVGNGVDPLLLNAAQARRPGRIWWRMLVDTYGASDVISPEIHLRRLWPGGPATATLIARHGPDNRLLERIELRSESGETLAALMDRAVGALDGAYVRALRDGRLAPDPTLVLEEEEDPELLEDSLADDPLAEATPLGGTLLTLQIDTADAAALGAAELALRAVPGMRQVTPLSLALGGVSVMRAIYDGDVEGLRIALAARGYQVADAGGGQLRIRRGAPAAAPPPATVPDPAEPAQP